MLKKFAFLAIAIIAITAFWSCNSDAEIYNSSVSYSSTQIKSFRLENNKAVLRNLDTIFFSIDLVNARIFNADSLPYGTKVNKLVVKIGTDNCSAVEITMPSSNGGDTIVNYMTNSTDSIDFSRGSVALRVVSYDGKAERKYIVNVNVHKVMPDSLYWNSLAVRQLPSSFSTPTAQKTVRQGDKAICLSTDGSAYCIATTDSPAADNWQMSTPTLSFDPEISTLSATDDAIFILSKAGDLYKSTDLGLNWVSTGETWKQALGCYNNSLLGLSDNGGALAHVSFPALSTTPADKNFPIAGASNLVDHFTKWSINPQAIFVGGEKADGSLSNAVWGFDGRKWLKLSESLPVAIADASLIPYTIAKTDSTTWQVKNMPALLLIGGRTANGLNSKTYISRDMGLTWRVGDNLITLPDYLAPRYDAQAIIEETTFTAATESRSASAWREYAPRPLPGWWSIDDIYPSRAIAPATSWECPFIYWFGGYDIDGNLYNTIWKGVINRLMFRPLE